MSSTKHPILVPDELWRAAKVAAQASGSSVTDVINDALRDLVRQAPLRSPVEWRTVAGLRDYRVNRSGEIQSKRTGAWFPIRGWLSGSGYLYVKVVDDMGRKRSRTVHTVVAEAFHGQRPEGMEVRHLDGVRTNNSAANLCYGTPSENRYDSVRHGTHPSLARRRSRTVNPPCTHDLDGDREAG